MAEVARFKVKTTGWPGAPGITTHYYTRSGVTAWNSHAPNIIANILSAYGDLKPILPSSFAFEVLGEYDVCEDSTGEILYSGSVSSAGDIGTGSDQYAPLVTGIVCTWRTTGVVAGKHVRGRTFLVPVHIDVPDTDGTPTAAALAAVAAYAANMISTPTNTDLVVWARPKQAVPHTDPKTYTRFGSVHSITHATVKDTFAVLRSRRD